MDEKQINIQKTIDHWVSRSDQDFETMLHLFKSKDFHWSLFIGHMVIERLLKAVIVKVTNNHAPLTHDLRRLAKLSEIEFNEEQNRQLDTITAYNINARYDDYKQDFYKRCSLTYADIWIVTIKELRTWIKAKL